MQFHEKEKNNKKIQREEHVKKKRIKKRHCVTMCCLFCKDWNRLSAAELWSYRRPPRISWKDTRTAHMWKHPGRTVNKQSASPANQQKEAEASGMCSTKFQNSLDGQFCQRRLWWMERPKTTTDAAPGLIKLPSLLSACCKDLMEGETGEDHRRCSLAIRTSISPFCVL